MEAIMPAFSSPVIPASLRPGTVVTVLVFPFFRHKGIVSDRLIGGKPMVLSNSARTGGVAEEPWDVFAAGQPVLVEGYPGGLPPALVLYRARSRVGTKYHLLNWNCEHLVSYSHGLASRSPQVAIVAAAVLIAGLAAFVAD
jgi:Lecithin retinol acyltransferase